MSVRPVCKNCKHFEVKEQTIKTPTGRDSKRVKYTIRCKKKDVVMIESIQTDIEKIGRGILLGKSLPMACFEK